jgi:hypothetical protein
MAELRQLSSELRLFFKDFNININPKDDLFDKIIFYMADFPLEYIQKFSAKWEEYNSKGIDAN